MPVKKTEPNHKHLTFEDREIIEKGIENRASKSDIARTLAKDPTTIAKEISAHRIKKPRNTFNNPNLCIHFKECKRCFRKCSRYEEPGCKFRDRSPGACNGCPKRTCKLDKYYYHAKQADQAYRTELSESREGFNLSWDEQNQIGAIIAPLLKQGQSVYQILSSHPEIKLSARSLYTYIESGLFKPFGVDNFTLKEQVNRRPRKAMTKLRKDPAHYEGRRYEDFLRFRSEELNTPYVEMDTVYNHDTGSFVQTLMFPFTNLMIGFLHQEKTSASMAETFNMLEQRLGGELFAKLFPVLLTDRGSEFEKYSLFECSQQGYTRTRVFYCAPRASQQKPFVENNHNYVRDIIPNGIDLHFLTQAKVDLMFSHINSSPRKILGDKSPVEAFSFFYGRDTLDLLHVSEIPRDLVILKPYLLTR